jgi:hypothetical protein
MSEHRQHVIELAVAERKCLIDQHHALEAQHHRLDAMLQLLLARHGILRITGYELDERGLVVSLPDEHRNLVERSAETSGHRSTQGTRPEAGGGRLP